MATWAGAMCQPWASRWPVQSLPGSPSPSRQSFAISGDAGVGYMLGNIEATVRYNLGITIIHINNSAFAGYGPGFWGPGNDPHTYAVSPPDVNNLSKVAGALGLYSERVEKPGEIIPALNRALNENAKNRPAYLEFICSQYPVWAPWVGLAPKGASREYYSEPSTSRPASKFLISRSGDSKRRIEIIARKEKKCLTSIPND